ncbi:MAG: class I SAM-dependent methyltransferase [Caldilineaceae bacterium]
MPCTICTGSTLRIWQEGAYQAEHCAQCGVIQATGPTAPTLYDERYYVENYLSHSGVRVQHFQQMVQQANLPLHAPLLDVGAGVGFFLKSLPASLREQAVAVEPAAYARNLLQQEQVVPLVAASLTDLPRGQEYFATITLWDVLAHVPEPASLLHTLREKMAPGGQLLIKTPHHPVRLFQVAKLLGPVKKGRAILHIPAQLFHFTPTALTYLLGATGFTVISTQWTSEAPVPYRGTLRILKERVLGAFLRASTRYASFLCVAEKSKAA